MAYLKNRIGRAAMNKRRGYILLELVITLIIFAILTVMAAPMVTSIKAETDLNDSTENLIAVIKKAQADSKLESRIIKVNLNTNNASTDNEYTWSSTGNAKLYKSPAEKAFYFGKNGRLQQSLTSTTPISLVILGVCNGNGNTYSRQITINYLGVITDKEVANCV